MSSRPDSHSGSLSDARRLDALRDTGLLDRASEESLDRLTNLAFDSLRPDAAVIAVSRDGEHFVKSYAGREKTDWEDGAPQLAQSLCRRTVEGREVVVIDDVACLNPKGDREVLEAAGIRACLAAPLVANGAPLGCFSVVSSDVRSWSDDEIRVLQDLAQIASSEIELRAHARELEFARQALLDSERRYRTFFERNPDGSFSLAADGTFTAVNREATQIAGYSREELLAMTFDALLVEEEKQHIWELFARTLAGEEQSFEMLLRRKDGALREIAVRSMPVVEGGEIVGAHGVAKDVTEANRSRRELEKSERRYQRLFEHNVAGVFRSTVEGVMLEANEAFASMLGFTSPRDLENLQTAQLYEDPSIRERLVRTIRDSGRLVNREVKVIGADGQPRWLLVNASMIEAPDGSQNILGTMFDITERKDIENQLRTRALYDDLTGLANRTLFEDRLRQAILRLRRDPDAALAVLFLDLDRFKVINDSLGHHIGDQVLMNVSRRLEGVVREADTVARFGGDEFAILLEGLSSEEDAIERTRRIAQPFEMPFLIAGDDYPLTASIGIALTRESEDMEGSDLLRQADIAMYRAKAIEGVSWHVYNPDLDADATRRLHAEVGLRRGIRKDEFFLVYQPIVKLTDGSVAGVETLVRWKHPKRGVVRPGDFISLAEDTGLILELGRTILRMGCSTAASWTASNGTNFPFFVNISPRQFVSSDFVEQIKEVISEFELDPTILGLEVTESLVMEVPERVLELRDLGIGIVLDDFGTGYSSLAYLKRLPVQAIKIDALFVDRIDTDPRDRAIVQTILDLGENLSFDIIAEGVEREEQVRILRELGCKWGQGYFYSRPVTSDQLPEWLRKSYTSESQA